MSIAGMIMIIIIITPVNDFGSLWTSLIYSVISLTEISDCLLIAIDLEGRFINLDCCFFIYLLNFIWW